MNCVYNMYIYIYFSYLRCIGLKQILTSNFELKCASYSDLHVYTNKSHKGEGIFESNEQQKAVENHIRSRYEGKIVRREREGEKERGVGNKLSFNQVNSSSSSCFPWL